MADIKGLEKAFGTASEEARRTYDILNGTGGRGGLEQKYLIALANKEKNDAKPGSVRNFNIKEFNALKASYDAAAAAYKRAQDAKNATRKELNDAQGTSEKEKGASGLVDRYNEAVNKLKNAEALIPSRGQAQYDAAVQAAYDAGNAAEAAGGKIAPLPKPAAGVKRLEDKTVKESDGTLSQEEVANNKFKDYTINSDGSVVKTGGTRSYFVSTKNADGSSTMQEYKSIATARDAFLKNYSEPGQLDALKKQMVSRNWISEKQLANGEWLNQ
jgi:hypothetical protein